ncbi:MAG: hypothetical protein U9R72_13870 [Chloroflexota bacterium]|nr:hypothetical protein [Chloroflexota bacterium]
MRARRHGPGEDEHGGRDCVGAWLREYLPPSAKGLRYKEEDVRGDRFCYFLGVNWAAFVADLQATGGFNPDFGPGSPTASRGQETEMQKRLWESGVKQVYVPEAKVWHYVPQDRCSPRWALGRGFQHGVERGLKGEPQVLDMLGLPKWMVRQWVEKAIEAAKRTVPGGREQRFAAYYELCNYTGFVRGVRRISTGSDGDAV